MPNRETSPWLIFLLVAIAQFMVTLDIAITNVALPTIKEQLHFAQNSLQWVITAYALTFGGFLLLGGRTADLFGRRRTLLFGITAFSCFSLLIGLTQNSIMLIVLRALQGLAAAFMSPSALSIVVVTFKDGAERNKALAYWTLVATGGAAMGLLLGGLLTQYAGWRWNFFINVPIGIGIIFAILRFVQKSEKEETSKSLDFLGALLVTTGLMLQVLAFSQASNWGWLTWKTLGTLGIAVVLILSFLWNESNAKHPLMPLSILKIRNVIGANAMMAPMYGTMLGMFFLTTLYFQNILQYSPVKTGVAFLPFPLILGFMATRISGWVRKYGFKRFLIFGPILAALGMAWLARLPVNGGYWKDVFPTLFLMPIGIGMTFAPLYAAATSGTPAHEAGLASGLITTSQQMGGALGLAILSSVAATISAVSRNPDTSSALVRGFDRGYLTAVIFMIVVAALGIIVIKEGKESSTTQSDSVVEM